MAKSQTLKAHRASESTGGRTETDWSVVESCFPEAILLHLSRTGDLIDANARARGLLAADPGTSILKYLQKQDRATFTSAFQRVSARQCSYEPLIIGVFDKDGIMRYLRGWLTPSGSAQSGEVILAAQDATPLHEERERLGEIVEGSSEGIIVHRNTQILYANERMAEMLGFGSADEIFEQGSIAGFLHPDDRKQVTANVEARLAGRDGPRDYQFRILTRSGETRWVDCRAGLVTWGGEPAVSAACFDITEQKRADQLRAETEMLFRRVFDLSPDILTLTRMSDGRFDFVSRSFFETLGYKPEEVIGRTSADIGLWSAGTARDQLLETLKENDVVHAMESQVRRRDGEPIDLAMSATTLEYRGESYILMVSHDITERKRQRQELIESKQAAELANRTKSEFLANISHELRTPLNAVIGFAELMNSEALGPLGNPQYLDYSGDILEAGRHLLSIINDILDLSKLEAGRLSVSLDRVYVTELMTSCSRLVAERARSAGLTLDIQCPEDDLEVIADPKRLKQPLLTLLANAIKFTPERGRVDMHAESTDSGMVRFTIADTGIGMSEEELQKALTPFGQIDSSLARRYDGAGLGLPLVLALVEMQQGRFELKSTPGTGTVATIEIPRPRK